MNEIVEVMAKPVHMAKHIRQDGAVSPLCAKTPRALNLAKAVWTIRPEAVTCKKCSAILRSAT